MKDPDGLDGKAEQVVTVHTRGEPKPAAGGKIYHVYPAGFTGQKQEPAFTGLLGAYFTGVELRQLQYLPAARPTRRHDPPPNRTPTAC